MAASRWNDISNLFIYTRDFDLQSCATSAFLLTSALFNSSDSQALNPWPFLQDAIATLLLEGSLFSPSTTAPLVCKWAGDCASSCATVGSLDPLCCRRVGIAEAIGARAVMFSLLLAWSWRVALLGVLGVLCLCSAPDAADEFIDWASLLFWLSRWLARRIRLLPSMVLALDCRVIELKTEQSRDVVGCKGEETQASRITKSRFWQEERTTMSAQTWYQDNIRSMIRRPLQEIPKSCIRAKSTSALPTASPGFIFDIDGVLKIGPKVLSQGQQALRILSGENKQNRRFPFILVTNGGGITEEE